MTPALRRILGALDAALPRRPSLQELADAAGLCSHNRVCIVFHEGMGLSIGQYITQQRIRQSQQLLTETQLPLVQIALEVGYCDHSAFTFEFHRAAGVTPSEYRRGGIPQEARTP